MVFYIALFAIAVILGIPLASRNATKTKKIIYLSVMFLLMFVATTFRYGIGNDYFSYIRILNEIDSTSWGELFTLSHEPLFSVLTKCLTLITTNSEVIYAVYAVIILAPVAYTIYKHSDIAWISVAVYLCLTFFYTSLNFIRQSIAVSILLLAYSFIKQRKIIPVLILSVVAVLFHFTALVFIPFYLLTYFVKVTKKSVIIYSSVSAGALIICLIMKAAGANPLNLVANLLTSVTGRDYNSYIDSRWFEQGFGVEYLIMPLAVLALVMVSYFLGWKEKEESHTLLWFMLGNASIWSFIVYAFIVERFSMFIFIFSIIAIPSVLSYYAEKADKAAASEKLKKEDLKKMPGYSQIKSEEKSDNAFLLTVASVVGMFIYNCWGMAMDFHGAFPYVCSIPAIQDSIDELSTSDENFQKMYTNADLYTYLIQLKNVDYSYAILTTTNNYNGFLPAIRRAADYSGTGLNRSSEVEASTPYYLEYNNRKGEVFMESSDGRITYTTSDGIKLSTNDRTAVVTDSVGDTVQAGIGKVVFVLFDENGEIFDTMEYKVNRPQRSAAKVQLK